jgi:hypothetical protein
MAIIQFDKFNLNAFWDNTPTPLKYILIFSIFIVVSYFTFSQKMEDHHAREIKTIKSSIEATYTLIDNFESFRFEQDRYNREILVYLNNLHTLVEDLNATTNRKLDMILTAGSQNSEHIIEKILLLNESFERLSRAYQPNLESPDINKKPQSIGVRPR